MDSCAWPSGTWLVFHITLATADTHHPPPRCAHILWLVSISVQPMSMNINRCGYFCREEFISTPLLHTHFHIRSLLSYCPSAAICHMATKWSGILVGRFSPCCHPTNIHLLCPGPTKYYRRHYFQSSHCIYEWVKKNSRLCPATEQVYGIPHGCNTWPVWAIPQRAVPGRGLFLFSWFLFLVLVKVYIWGRKRKGCWF